MFRSILDKLAFEKLPIKVGILHSLTGTMAISEIPVVDATMMAINEINESGGILGRKIHAVVRDGCSHPQHFAKMALELITKEKVCVIFGCWTSDCRRSVKPLIEKHKHLLIYPLQYEGLETSPHIVYTGAAPNEQIIPCIEWALENLGKRLYLVGSDYIFPRTANEIIKDLLKELGGEVIGEKYIVLGGHDVNSIVQDIVLTKPDVIINTINGDSNLSFFRELRAQNILPENIPTISFSIGEVELNNLDLEQMAGDYAAWNYFQSIPSEANQQFVQNYKNNYGEHRVTDDPIEAGYFGVHLWAQAVKDAGTENVVSVRKAIKGQSYIAPSGTVYIDPENNHTWKIARVGRIRKDGQFDIIWSSMKPINPNPYPETRSKSEWHKFLHHLYQAWGNNWANPAQK